MTRPRQLIGWQLGLNMSLISIPFTFSAGAVIIASQHNSNFSTIYSDYNGNIDNTNIVAAAGIAYSKLTLTGSIVNADINASAAIADSKLATISTTGKVNISALTVASQAQGDIIYASSATAWVRLGPGTSGQFLKTQGASANPVWGGVGLNFISNTAITTAATSGAISVTSGTTYFVNFNLSTLSGNDTFVLQFNADGGNHYKYCVNGFSTDGTAIKTNGSAAASSKLTNTVLSGATRGATGSFYIQQLGASSQQYHFWGNVSYWDSTNNAFGNVYIGGDWENSANITSFAILTSGAATFSGNVYLYSIATA